MKQLKTINIGAQSFLPATSATLEHLQAATQDTVRAFLQALGVDISQPATRIAGMGISSNNDEITVSPGWIWVNNELLYCPGGTVTPGAGQVAVFALQETYSAADPVTFVDSNRVEAGQFNVYADRQAVVTAGAAGSGLADVETTPHANDVQWVDLVLLNGTINVGGTKAQYRVTKEGKVELRGTINVPPNVLVAVQMPDAIEPKTFQAMQITSAVSINYSPNTNSIYVYGNSSLGASINLDRFSWWIR
jgi:hypothetical protein